MMNMFWRDGVRVLILTGSAEREEGGIRCLTDSRMEVHSQFPGVFEAYIRGRMVGYGNSFSLAASEGDLVEFKPMKPSRETFTSEEIERARTTTYISVVNQEENDNGPFVFDGKLDDVIASLIAIRESIPPEFRHTAECEIESEYESSQASIAITYSRKESDEEVSSRLRSELLRKEAQEREERAVLERLQKKYGP